MKIQTQKEFQPITVVLETQQEVDALFALVNHCGIQKTVGFGEKDYSLLSPYVNRTNTNRLHDLLVAKWNK